MDQAQGDLEHAKSDLERGFYDTGHASLPNRHPKRLSKRSFMNRARKLGGIRLLIYWRSWQLLNLFLML
jgi:hypothetical protein